MRDEREFKEEEVRAIFARAAERQHEAEAARSSSGLTLAELEAIGQEAGLDPEHVAAAAAELLKPHRAPIQNTFLGMPVELRRTRVLRAPLSEEGWGSLVADLQETFKASGVATDIGGVREWRNYADARRTVRVTVEPEGVGARITVEQTLWPQVLGFGMGAAVNAAMALVFFALWAARSTADALLLPALVMGLFSLVFGAGAVIGTRRQGRRQLDRFDAVLERATAYVDEQRETQSAREAEPAPATEARLDLDAALEDDVEQHAAERRRTRS